MKWKNWQKLQKWTTCESRERLQREWRCVLAGMHLASRTQLGCSWNHCMEELR